MSRLIFVDTEGANPTPSGWTLREFGAVDYYTGAIFHGPDATRTTFELFREWLAALGPPGRRVFVADNPAYDWPPIAWHFALYFSDGGRLPAFDERVNPFGHSARRIGDFYAGLRRDFHKASEWKSMRITPHDHNPVNDAMGNVEAFAQMIEGVRNGRWLLGPSDEDPE